jgi:hypothetical protein
VRILLFMTTPTMCDVPWMVACLNLAAGVTFGMFQRYLSTGSRLSGG